MFKGLTSHKSKELHGSCQGKSTRVVLKCFALSVVWIFGNMQFVLVFLSYMSHCPF